MCRRRGGQVRLCSGRSKSRTLISVLLLKFLLGRAPPAEKETEMILLLVNLRALSLLDVLCPPITDLLM